jgi:serine/threonine-protein kinase
VTPERWQAVKTILDAAIERASAERAAFLDEACGADAALRGEIESLLAVDRHADGFLEPPAVPRHAERDDLLRLRAALGAAYRIERELGRGGMSTVYLAQDLKHRRPVAIKVLRQGAATIDGVQRFEREIEVLARLQHPNILPLLDSGAVDGALYYVMPFVSGESLRARLARESRLPIDEALRIACEVADALGYAHSQGIVHRDIKPENILLSGGHAVVADFGIGKLMLSESDAHLTSAGSVIGTPAYVSPEQGSGKPDLDGRSDLYSLGIVLYEMLAGEAPFTGPTPQAVIVKRLTEPVPRLRAHRLAIPDSVERVMLTLLAREPADRYATAGELLHALESPSAGGERTSGQRGAASAETPSTPSIVVLPFANMSADPDDEYLSDGITEEIINALTRLRTIRVVARTSSFAFKGKATDVRAIARRLAVGSVLEGSVRRDGSRLRVGAELIDVADGCRIWAEQFDRQVDDVFAVEDELARRIVESLRVTLLGARGRALVTPPTTRPRAHELYLKGRYCWNRRTERSLRRGIAYFEEAIEHDPRFALAHAGVAESYAILCIHGHLPPAEGMPRARAAARHALELDAALPEAHATLGCIEAVYDWDWSAAERDFQHALMLNPRHPTSHQRYALDCLIPQARFAEASAALERARALDPLALAIEASIGLPLFFARRYDEAAAAYLKVLDLDPSFGIAHYFLGQVHVQRQRFDEAIEAFQRASALLGPSAEVSAALAHAYGVSRRHARARSALDALLRERETRYVSPCLVAQAYLGLGQTDMALGWLERAREERAADLIWLNVRPVFDALRPAGRFRALLARVGLEALPPASAQERPDLR